MVQLSIAISLSIFVTTKVIKSAAECRRSYPHIVDNYFKQLNIKRLQEDRFFPQCGKLNVENFWPISKKVSINI